MKFEFSAGGIVYKYKDSTKEKRKDNILILVCKHSYHHNWVFPKGLIGDKEENKTQSKEETAVREVKEETGVEGKIESQISPVEFNYKWENEEIKKTVYYFIMQYIDGDITQHDDEMEDVEFIDYNDVLERLKYDSDKKAWMEAKKLI